MRTNPIDITPQALDRIKTLLSSRGKAALGIRIGIKTKGCSGLAYSLEYVDTADPADEVFHLEDITLFIDPRAALYILGTQMDFVADALGSGFVFRNPNEKGRCGCGQSFHV